MMNIESVPSSCSSTDNTMMKVMNIEKQPSSGIETHEQKTCEHDEGDEGVSKGIKKTELQFEEGVI